MIKLEDLSNKELRAMAKDMHIPEHHNMPKPDLIKRIHKIQSNSFSGLFEKEMKETLADEIQISTQLSFKASQWQKYFQRINLSAEVFLQRFPYHLEARYITELINSKQKFNGDESTKNEQ